MSAQHLSDEAVAAFADGVLRGHARDRASRHLADCSECARAVRVQREAVLALRAAPAPQLPSGLLDRLRAVPSTTPIQLPALPAAMSADGTALFGGFAPIAALAPPSSAAQSALTPSALTPSALTPSALTPSALTPSALTPSVSPASADAPVAHPSHHWLRLRRVPPVLLTAAAVAAVGVFAVASSDGAGAVGPISRDGAPSQVEPANQLSGPDEHANRGLLSYRQP